jgi:hypothetical protein
MIMILEIETISYDLWRYYEAMHGVGGLALCKMERSQSHHCLISNCALESFLVRIRKELDKGCFFFF